MAKNQTYRCVLFEKGDKVIPKYSELFEKVVLEIEDTELKTVGIFTVQQLKFKGKPLDITDLSNYYEPAAESIEKYKDGLKYYNDTKVRITQQKDKSTGKVLGGFRRSKDDTLTEDDLKFKIIKRH